MAQGKYFVFALLALTSVASFADDRASVKTESLIRDASWWSSFDYKSSAYYELGPRLYKDKVTILEMIPAYRNSVINLFCVALDRRWNLDIDKMTTMHMDALDALAIGAMAANPAIVQEALNTLPLSKAVPENQRTADYKNKDLVIEGKINIDQMIWQAYDWMNMRLNKYRTIKAAVIPAGILAYYGLTSNKFFDAVMTYTAPIDLDLNKNNQTVKKVLKWSTGAILGLSTYFTHRLQNLYVAGYVATFEVMLTSSKVTFNPAKTKQYLIDLGKKVNAFGLGAAYEQRLLKLAAQI